MLCSRSDISVFINRRNVSLNKRLVHRVLFSLEQRIDERLFSKETKVYDLNSALVFAQTPRTRTKESQMSSVSQHRSSKTRWLHSKQMVHIIAWRQRFQSGLIFLLRWLSIGRWNVRLFLEIPYIDGKFGGFSFKGYQ